MAPIPEFKFKTEVTPKTLGQLLKENDEPAESVFELITYVTLAIRLLQFLKKTPDCSPKNNKSPVPLKTSQFSTFKTEVLPPTEVPISKFTCLPSSTIIKLLNVTVELK